MAYLPALAFEHLFGQEIQHVSVAAGERGHEPVTSACPRSDRAAELQPGRPSLCAVCQRRHRRIGQAQPAHLLPGAGAQLPRRAVNRSSGARSSASCPRGRSRASASGGSARLASTGCRPGGRCSSRKSKRSVHRLGADQVVVIQDQQRLAVTGLGGQDSLISAVTSPFERRRGGRAEERADPLFDALGMPGPAQPPHGARTGPGRCRHRPATATRPDGRRTEAQSASRAVLPDPAGAQTRTRPRSAPSSSRRARRGRGTNPARGPGTFSLVASSTSRAAAGGSVTGDLHAHCPQPSYRCDDRPIVVPGRSTP